MTPLAHVNMWNMKCTSDNGQNGTNMYLTQNHSLMNKLTVSTLLMAVWQVKHVISIGCYPRFFFNLTYIKFIVFSLTIKDLCSESTCNNTENKTRKLAIKVFERKHNISLMCNTYCS